MRSGRRVHGERECGGGVNERLGGTHGRCGLSLREWDNPHVPSSRLNSHLMWSSMPDPEPCSAGCCPLVAALHGVLLALPRTLGGITEGLQDADCKSLRHSG